MKKTSWMAALGIALAGVLVACGGGGGGGGASTTLSGSVVKGPVNGATVTIRNAANNAVIATTTTNADGSYSVSISFEGTVLIEAAGGNFTDEATGGTVTLSTSLYSVATAGGGSVTAMVTPFTTFAYAGAANDNGSVSSSAYTASLADIAQAFGVPANTLATVRPVVTGSDVNPYGQLLRGFSKYVQLNGGTLLQTLQHLESLDEDAALAQFSADFTAAFAQANPGTHVTFDVVNGTTTISGTGAGGGSGTCGVAVSGTISTGGMTVPVNQNFCISGIAAGSCSSGNASISQAIGTALGAGGASLNYSFSSTCAVGATAIVLQ